MDGDRLRLPANRNCYRLSRVSWALLKLLVSFGCLIRFSASYSLLDRCSFSAVKTSRYLRIGVLGISERQQLRQNTETETYAFVFYRLHMTLCRRGRNTKLCVTNSSRRKSRKLKNFSRTSVDYRRWVLYRDKPLAWPEMWIKGLASISPFSGLFISAFFSLFSRFFS